VHGPLVRLQEQLQRTWEGARLLHLHQQVTVPSPPAYILLVEREYLLMQKHQGLLLHQEQLLLSLLVLTSSSLVSNTTTLNTQHCCSMQVVVCPSQWCNPWSQTLLSFRKRYNSCQQQLR
jgi:hypothetical protein